MKAPRRIYYVAAALLLGLLCRIALCGGQKKAPRHFALSGEYNLTFSNADEIIAILHDSLASHASAVTLRYTAQGDHTDDIRAMIDEMMNLAMYNTSSPTEGDYIRYQYGGYHLSYGYTQENGAHTVTVQPIYYTTVEEEQQADAQVADILAGFQFGKDTSDEEKIKAVYDYVCSHVSYDLVHANNSHYHRDSTAYAALVKGSASCQGYAVAVFRLLKELGIENTIVTGTAVNDQGEEEFHAWNQVELDGASYYVDATWDAGREEYAYFMMTEEDFPRHTVNAPSAP